MRITAVVNTRQEETNITRCLRSVVAYVDEIVLVDMHSTDKTVQLAREFTKNVYKFKPVEYVEPARNFAISKATGDWIFLLDADEIVSEPLGLALRRLADSQTYSYYRIPRKNLIFGKWIRHSGWWPDYQIRLFQKGAVVWNDEIHSIPTTYGKGTDLQAEEKNALTHNNYRAVSPFIARMDRYTTQETKQLLANGEKFSVDRLLNKPANEFLSRYFAREGYKDGLHGLVLSLLQAVSYFIVELKLWETEHFQESTASMDDTMRHVNQIRMDTKHWYLHERLKREQGLNKIILKIREAVHI